MVYCRKIVYIIIIIIIIIVIMIIIIRQRFFYMTERQTHINTEVFEGLYGLT